MAPRAERPRLLIVDDDQQFLRTLVAVLQGEHVVFGAASGTEALERLDDGAPDLVLLDVNLPDMSGLDCIGHLRSRRPGIGVVMITGSQEIRTAVEAMKLGADDYVVKPFTVEALLGTIRSVLDEAGPRAPASAECESLAHAHGIVGLSPGMTEVLRLVRQVGPTAVPVLICGESGTGKELVAKAVRGASPRRDGPFVAVNCARFSGDLIESDLFGHEKGAFTGAASLRKGVFEQADGGTLLLDEIGAMPLSAQDRLLRVVEEKRFTRVGGGKAVEVDVRLVFATNRDLKAETEKGSFREDLYYRIQVVPISLPPLRARREDIPLLVEHFIRKHRSATNATLEGFTPEAMETLVNRDWPGNVRELKNTVLMLMSLTGKRTLDRSDLDAAVGERRPRPPLEVLERPSDLADVRARADREAVLRALDECGWNQSLASRLLGVHRNTLRNLMDRHGISGRRPAQ